MTEAQFISENLGVPSRSHREYGGLSANFDGTISMLVGEGWDSYRLNLLHKVDGVVAMNSFDGFTSVKLPKKYQKVIEGVYDITYDTSSYGTPRSILDMRLGLQRSFDRVRQSMFGVKHTNTKPYRELEKKLELYREQIAKLELMLHVRGYKI